MKIPGINIQYPWSQLLLSGEKTIETRFYPIPAKYLSVPLAIIETPGETKNFVARVVGTITFAECTEYRNEKQFREDQSKHLISPGSPFDWSSKKKKWKWSVKSVRKIRPTLAPKRKGIIWTTSLQINDL